MSLPKSLLAAIRSDREYSGLLSQIVTLVRLRSSTLSLRSRVSLILCSAFVVPILVLAVIAVPRFRCPAPTTPKDLSTFLWAAWAVHGAVAVTGIVILVFLLQTASFSKRTSTAVLTLAVKSRILIASGYGLGTTLGIGVVLTMMEWSTAATWPVLISLSVATISNSIVILHVMARSLRFLGSTVLAQLEGDLMLSQVKRSTRVEVLQSVSAIWLLKNTDKTSVSEFFIDLPDGLPIWQYKVKRPGRMLADIDLRRLESIGNDVRRDGEKEKGVRVLARLGETPEVGETILEILGNPRWHERFLAASAFKWHGRSEDPEDVLLDEVADTFIDSVQDGDIRRFKEGMTRCVVVVDTCMATLDGLGMAATSGTDELSAIRTVHRMLRFGLEEALKTRRSDFALSAGRDLVKIAKVGFDYGNRSILKDFLAFYPFLRRVVVSLGLSKDPIYKELYWRSLREFGTFSVPSRRQSDDATFAPLALGVVEETFIEMMKDSIADGGSDFSELLDVWHLTFDPLKKPRQRTFRNGEPIERPSTYKGQWLTLLAWALFLCGIGRLDQSALGELVRVLAGQFDTAADLANAYVGESSEDSDAVNLDHWMLFSLPTERVYTLDGQRYITLAFLALMLQTSYDVPPIQIVEGAADVASEVESSVRELPTTEGALATLFSRLAGDDRDITEHLSRVVESFTAAKKTKDARKRAELRAKPLSQRLVQRFESELCEQYRLLNPFTPLSTVFSLLPDPLQNNPKASSLVQPGWVPKEFFVEGADHTDTKFLAHQYAEGLSNASFRDVASTLASANEDESRSVPFAELVDHLATFCHEQRGGLLIIRGTGDRINIFTHRDFRYGSPIESSVCFGTLAGVTVAYGMGLDHASALYLPDGSVHLRHGVYADGADSLASVEYITADRANELVESWEADGKLYTPDERRAKIDNLQEHCGVTLRSRTVASGKGVVVFTSENLPEDEL